MSSAVLVLLLVVLCALATLTVLLAAQPTLAETRLARFPRDVASLAELAPSSPLVVTVYERSYSSGEARRDHDDNDRYVERLIVVKPHNWIVYTDDGLRFYLVSNNVSDRTARCDLDRQLIAVEFPLQSRDLSADDNDLDRSGRLRVACINYTLDQLVRLFGVRANRTYVDLSTYFDRRRNPVAPALTVDAVLDYLLQQKLI